MYVHEVLQCRIKYMFSSVVYMFEYCGEVNKWHYKVYMLKYIIVQSINQLNDKACIIIYITNSPRH